MMVDVSAGVRFAVNAKIVTADFSIEAGTLVMRVQAELGSGQRVTIIEGVVGVSHGGGQIGVHSVMPNYAAEFAESVMSVAGVSSLSEAPGKYVRLRVEGGTVAEVGHIIDDTKWFPPAAVLALMADIRDAEAVRVVAPVPSSIVHAIASLTGHSESSIMEIIKNISAGASNPGGNNAKETTQSEGE